MPELERVMLWGWGKVTIEKMNFQSTLEHSSRVSLRQMIITSITILKHTENSTSLMNGNEDNKTQVLCALHRRGYVEFCFSNNKNRSNCGFFFISKLISTSVPMMSLCFFILIPMCCCFSNQKHIGMGIHILINKRGRQIMIWYKYVQICSSLPIIVHCMQKVSNNLDIVDLLTIHITTTSNVEFLENIEHIFSVLSSLVMFLKG